MHELTTHPHPNNKKVVIDKYVFCHGVFVCPQVSSVELLKISLPKKK